MNVRRLLPLILLAALGWAPPATLGCCCIPHQPDNTPTQIELPELKAFIYHKGDTEHLILSERFSGSTDQFAWIIPVESRPHVDTQSGAPFHELQRLTEIRLPQPPASSAMGAPAAPSAPPPVKVLERKEAGPFDIAVLQATSSGGLYDWLHQNGFGMTTQTRDALDFYVKKGWVFVAARIRPASLASSAVASHLKDGTISPLHLSFKAKELSYPLRVTSANPGTSHIELYVAVNDLTTPEGFGANRFTLTASGRHGFNVQGPPGAVVSQGEFPTLRKLLGPSETLTHLSATMTAEERNRDLVLATLSAENH